jgi:sirohydrochlorin cobaltochelatase
MAGKTVRSGLALLAHGARDPRWSEPLERLRDHIGARAPGVAVELAFLEQLQPDLAGAIERLVAAGSDAITVVPVFLGQGGHVRRDVPEQVEGARRRFPAVDIRVVPAIGDDAGVIDALASYCLAAMPR